MQVKIAKTDFKKVCNFISEFYWDLRKLENNEITEFEFIDTIENHHRIFINKGMIIEDLIYTSKISLTHKAYNLQLPNAKRVIIRLEVNEKPYNYKRHIMPFELVAFHCEECGEKYIASFLEYVAHYLSKEAKNSMHQR